MGNKNKQKKKNGFYPYKDTEEKRNRVQYKRKKEFFKIILNWDRYVK